MMGGSLLLALLLLVLGVGVGLVTAIWGAVFWNRREATRDVGCGSAIAAACCILAGVLFLAETVPWRDWFGDVWDHLSRMID